MTASPANACRLRVTHVVPDLGVGGAEAVLRTLVDWQVDRMDVSVVALLGGAEDVIVGRHSQGRVKVVGLGKELGPDARTPFNLAKALRSLQPAVVHSHRNAMGYLLPLLPTIGLPVLHTLHTTPAADGPRWLRAPYDLAFRHWVRSVVASPTNARLFEERYGRPPSAVIPHGIDTKRFDVGASAGGVVRRAEAIGPEDLVVMSVARLAPEKRHADLLIAFRELLASHPSSRLLLAGDGQLRADLEAEVAGDAVLHGAVRFLGTVDDVPSVVAAADIVVLASEREGLPLSVLEAMAARKPVVATAVGGVPDVIADGVTGLLVPAMAPTALAGALRRLADDTVLRARLGEAARAYVVRHHEAGPMGESYLELYQTAPG